jgi:hypothetical protein
MEAKIEATRCEFYTQVKEVEAWTKRRKGTGTRTGAVKPSKFDGTIFWAVFWHVRDLSRAQLLDMTGEIHTLDHCPAVSGHRCATQSPERTDL